MAALKVLLPIYYAGPTASESDVGGMTVDTEPSYQYYYIVQ